jgi:[ribosomal protein S5]-alanine N-acetyltransferase
MFPIIDADKFQLREMTIQDVDDMFCYYSNPEMMKFTSTDAHTSKDETLARITKLSNSFNNKKGIAWVIEDKVSKRVIGDIGIYYITSDIKKAGIGFNISQEYWNKGYGTQALTCVLRHAINKMNINRIEATCKVDNIASARVMEKSGMHYEGILRQYSNKKGKYYDVKIYSMIKDDLKC